MPAFNSAVLSLKTSNLETHRTIATGIVSLVAIAGLVVASNESGALAVALVVIPVTAFFLRRIINTVLGFFYIRWFFEACLDYIDQRNAITSGSPSLRLSNFRAYGTYKAILILSRERIDTCIIIAGLCVAGFSLIVPPIFLAWLIWQRFLNNRRNIETESDLLQKSGNHPAVAAIFRVESSRDFGELVGAVLSKEAEAA